MQYQYIVDGRDIALGHLSAVLSKQWLSAVKLHKTDSWGKEWSSILIAIQMALRFYTSE